MTKPKLYEFMFRGIDAADALTLLERWDSLTAAELATWGFSDEPETSPAFQQGNVVPFPSRSASTPRRS